MMLGGCLDINSANSKHDNEKTKEAQASPSSEMMVSVQDYTGEGYALPYGKETDKIAEAPYYFISMTSKEAAIKPVYDLYISNPDENIEILRNAYEESLFEPDHFNINIQLFMADKQAEPSKEIFDRITKELEEMPSLPKGSYSLFLNDNFIEKQSADGTKDNSLERSFPDYIIKE